MCGADVDQLVETKNGVTFNGHLVECDNFMNVTLREVYQTSADGEKFWKMKEMYIKGNIVRCCRRTRAGRAGQAELTGGDQIKYFRIADTILDSAMEEQEKARAAGRSRGGRGGMSERLHANSGEYKADGVRRRTRRTTRSWR